MEVNGQKILAILFTFLMVSSMLAYGITLL